MSNMAIHSLLHNSVHRNYNHHRQDGVILSPIPFPTRIT
ncbi:hypothetical protein ACHAWC_007580 [Mediolabrus comicus]